MNVFVQSVLASSATTLALLAMVGWLTREVIKTRLTASVKHVFEKEIEAVKAENREREALLQAELKAQDTRLHADLRKKELQLQVLQSGVLTTRATRQSVASQPVV